MSTLLYIFAACSTPWEPKDKGPTLGDADDTGRVDESGTEETDTECGPFTAVIDADGVVGSVPFEVSFAVAADCAEGWSTTWDFGDGRTGSGDVASHTFLGSGDYTVTASLLGDDGTTTEATRTVRVRAAECPATEAPVQVGTLQHPELLEASGLVEGVVNPGVLWSHNDSGDSARLFALDVDGTDRGTFLLDGAPEGDWEDLALGESADGSPLILIGDIGANGAVRPTSTIYAVPEPVVGAGGEQLVSDWYSFELVFPDGDALDANAMMWDPVAGALYLAAEEDTGTTGIYKAEGPFAADDLVPLVRVAGITLGAEGLPGSDTPSGAGGAPLGDGFAIRTVDSAFFWRRDQAASVDEAWATEPCPLPLDAEDGGEAITFSADGAGYYTTGEGAGYPVWFVAFIPPEDPCPDGEVATIVVTPEVLEVPAEPTFSIDQSCLLSSVEEVRWNLGDGTTSAALEPTGLYLASGTYEVVAGVVDSTGASSMVTRTIEVLPASCPEPGDAESWGDVASDEVREASGLGQSTLTPGILWTHNDSGDSPRLFAVGTDGADHGQFTVDTPNRDWEDLSLGWDDTLGGPAIYVGDFGDNATSRTSVAVLVVPEPIVDTSAAPHDEEITEFSTLTLVYPDEPHNAETLMVDPVTGDLYVVTKDYAGDTAIYRKAAPHLDGTETTLELVANLQFGEDPLPGSGATTGGDFSPLGDRIAIRTYTGAFLWRRDQSYSVADAFAGAPCDMDAPDEPQGEALTFTTDGTGYLTLSEGNNQPIYFTSLD